MQKKIHRLLSALLVLAMAVSMTPAISLPANAAETTQTTNKNAVWEYIYDISAYRSATENHVVNNDSDLSMTVYSDYPAKDGYVFAGWYTSPANTTPLSAEVTAGGAFAKFVPEELMKAVAQVSTTTDYETENSAIRFVAAVESLDYAQVGFMLNRAGSSRTYTHASNQVYTKLSAAVAGGVLTPTYFHSTATNMFALTLSGIKNQSANYTATPFWITLDGTKVDHIPTAQKTVKMGVDANMAAGLTLPPVVDTVTETTAWYDENKTEFVLSTLGEFKGFVTLSQTNTFEGKTIKLATDIVWNEGDASQWGTTPPANVWTPIGDGSNGFQGVFDGQGHTISGLYAKNGGYAAFVARLYGATSAVKNIRVVNSYFESDGTADAFHNAASIVGRANNGFTVSGIYTDAYFKGVKAVGIVGFCDSGASTITNCWFDGTIDVTGATNVGGIIANYANNLTATITNCLFTGTMVGTASGSSYVGGLVGIGPWSTAIKATNCLSAGDMTGVTGGVTGSVIGNNPGGNKSTYTKVYATNETHTNLKGAGGATFPVTAVAEADILGANAATVLSGLGFVGYWDTRTNDVPKLVMADTTWYDANKTEFVLYTAAQLYGLSILAETYDFKGKTIKLGADIVLNEGDAKTWAQNAPANMWNPIGRSDVSLDFEGTFDGQGHTISGLYYDSALYGGGLFAVTGTSAVIKNLKLTNSYIRSTHNNKWSATGSIAAFVNGTGFYNVYSDAIIDTNSAYTGGLGGRSQGTGSTVENCEFAGTINGTTANAIYIGGIFGGFNTNVVGTTNFKNNKFSGSVTGDNCVGGLAGFTDGTAGSVVTVDGFTYTGEVTATNTSNASLVGGVFGLTQTTNVTIKNTTVSGVVNAPLGIAGGLVGRVTTAPSVTIENSVFDGTLNGGTKLGGFVGQAQATTVKNIAVTIRNSTFSGAINSTSTGESTSAGLIASVNMSNTGTVTIELKDCLTEGSVIAAGPYAAGAIAQIMNVEGITVKVDGVISTADVQCSVSNVGGIIARVMGVNPSISVQNCLSKATFTADTWCTSQIIAHAQNNAAKMNNNFFVKTAYSADKGIESNGGNVTNAPVAVSEAVLNYLIDLYKSGMRPDYDGFEDSGYLIKDAQDLYGFNVYNEVKGFSGKTAKLAADITVNTGDASTWMLNAPAYNWRPVGALTGAGKFAGTFDGQGYTISGIYCAYPGGNSMGLFREVTGKVANFRLVNSYFKNTVESNYGYNAAIVAYLNGGTVSGIYTDAYVNTVDSYAGGIVGMVGGTAATIAECEFDGLLMAQCTLSGACPGTTDTGLRSHAKYVGGIAGANLATTLTIRDCIYSGKVMNECTAAHRTGGILGGAPQSGTGITITACLTVGEFSTLKHNKNNYTNFNMLMDCRGEKEGTSSVTTRPTNVSTLYADNYVLYQRLYNEYNVALQTGSSYIAGANSANVSGTRYNMTTLINKIAEQMKDGTSPLDFVTVWSYKKDTLPVLRIFDTDRIANPYYITVDGTQILCLEMTGETYAQYKDAKLKETLLEGQTNDNGWQLYALAYEYYDAITFKDVDYGENAYITKYNNTTLSDYTWYIGQMEDYGFRVVASNVVNTDDAYYTALTYNNHSYSVTYFANTGETYVTASNEMKFSPFMAEDYYKTADDKDPAKQTYSDITVTMVELSDGGMCQIIRLKNGHYIVIDGGTGTTAAGATVNGTTYTEAAKDRAELAAALGASATAYTNGDKNNPQVIVDAWIFTHDHADHVGWLRGGVYGAMQVDVYIKGFYYNFTDDFRVDAEFEIGGNTVQGYGNIAYAYQDNKGANGSNRYYKGSLDNGPFWVEYSATHKLANNVNTPSWGTKGIPIYRLQAGQKYYFDGVTMEVPYTQDQAQPSEYRMDINGSCAWLLFTDDHGNTYLEAGDTETWNQDAVIKLYDDYYDGGSGPNYALFGADLVNAFHHGLNLEVNGKDNHTRLNILFGIQNSNGNPATANTATNGNDGRTKFIFYTRGYLNSIFGYVTDESSWNSRNMRANHYLTGYVYPKLVTNSLNAAKAYPNLKSPIAFSSYCTKPDDKGVSWQGTTTVSFSASGISWNKQQTSSIYP